MSNKKITGANLKLALQQNNEKIKNYVSDKTQKIDQISYAQKTVNTELDYGYAKISSSLANANVTANKSVQLEMVKTNNIDFNSDNNTMLLKANKTYKISTSIYVVSANAFFTISDITNNIEIGRVSASDTSGSFIYIPETDCEIQLFPHSISSGAKYGNAVDKYSYLIIEEINRQIIIDPLQHVNDSTGIEDTPVGHIISHMGTVPPKHYLACDGAEYNIADYPYLAQHIIDNFGSVDFFGGDGTNTFAVPDLRGEFLRGTGTAIRNTGTGAEVGVHQEATQHIQCRLGGSTGHPMVTPNSTLTTNNQDTVIGSTSGEKYGSNGNSTSATINNYYTSRPTNTSVLYCIKYEPTYFMNTERHNTNYLMPNLYSTDEKVIGCWINGKPLYQKTIETITPTASSNGTYGSQRINVTELNIDIPVSLQGFVITDTYIIPIPFATNGDYKVKAFFDYIVNEIAFTNGYKDYSRCKAYITIKYTKTTDTENSFTTDMIQDFVTQGGNNNDSPSYAPNPSLPTYTEEEIQQAILDIVAEINKDEAIEEPVEEVIIDENEPMVIPETYEEDVPTVIPEEQEKLIDETETEGGTK